MVLSRDPRNVHMNDRVKSHGFVKNVNAIFNSIRTQKPVTAVSSSRELSGNRDCFTKRPMTSYVRDKLAKKRAEGQSVSKNIKIVSPSERQSMGWVVRLGGDKGFSEHLQINLNDTNLTQSQQEYLQEYALSTARDTLEGQQTAE
jgi:hypothetical protein